MNFRQQVSSLRARLSVLVSLALLVAAALVAGTPGAARADPGTCGNCPIPWPPPRIVYVPCSQLGPIDWWFFNQGPPFVQSGVRYTIVSSTPTLDVAYGRFVENPTDQPITGNWTATQQRMVTMTSSIALTIAGNGGRANPEAIALSVTLATGIQVAVSYTTTIGVGATAEVPPRRTMLGEYGLRSLDIVMDVQVVSMMQDRVTCAYREGGAERHTAHVPTINEGWRFTLT
ncbi:hypothetical protein [Phytohabitans houttuyneae]|uniref:Secreted protein n=1 Tax=Phytohabitans houttuyneae TaxID=1076126 RepID=A0A6V8KH37_9ACTN|nr:hypothetical protein [Phytohabitans houttuyneae]GFJ81326.1 hypothetical protein Phou_055060 [Phytohabitans houttuyneae]